MADFERRTRADGDRVFPGLARRPNPGVYPHADQLRRLWTLFVFEGWASEVVDAGAEVWNAHAA